jgi:hypothetical protein
MLDPRGVVMTGAPSATHLGFHLVGQAPYSYEWLGKTIVEASPQTLPSPWFLVVAMIVLLMIAVVLLFKEW